MKTEKKPISIKVAKSQGIGYCWMAGNDGKDYPALSDIAGHHAALGRMVMYLSSTIDFEDRGIELESVDGDEIPEWVFARISGCESI